MSLKINFSFKYRSPCSSSLSIPAHLQSIWSKEYTIRSEPFCLTSTPINRQILSTPSPPRKIRPKSESSTTETLSSSDILNMYTSTTSTNENKTDIITKTISSSSIEYHTSIIQSIEIVKRPLLFNQYDNDTSSRFFSSSTTAKTSVFDAINENQNITVEKEEISSINNNNKRFKRLNTDNDQDSLPQLTVQSSMDQFITPTKQNRIVLKRKSPNIPKQSSTINESLEEKNDNIQV